MNRCLRCNEEKATGCTLEHKAMKGKECLFSGESQYDIQEIKRVHNLIFEGEGLKVCFIDGGLGSGKSYKVDKVLEYRNVSNNEVDSLMFESFQTGYNENFIYILFLELVKNERKKPSFKKHLEVFKNNISIGNFILSIPVTLSLLIVFYTVLRVFDFTKQDLISTNVGYTLLIGITIITSLFILPYALTFRKEYTILNRDYYYKLVTKLLPEVLIIDDFERLTENQRRQIYEFINYLRINETDENKVETKLKRILILGDLKAVESAELLFKDGTKELITKEAFVTKYYDQRIVLGDWIDTFAEKYSTDYPQMPLNNAETEHIIKLLEYFSPLITRREFVMFMNNTKFNYDNVSFEYNLFNELETTKSYNLQEYYLNANAPSKINAIDEFLKLEQLLKFQIPYNVTYYIEKENPAGKVWENPTINDYCTELKVHKEIKHLERLLDAIRANKGFKENKILFFSTYDIMKNYINAPMFLFDIDTSYTITTKFSVFFKKNKSLFSDSYLENSLLEELNEISIGEISVLERMVEDRLSLDKKQFIISEYIDEESYKYRNIKNINENSELRINEQIIELAEVFEKFVFNFVFNVVHKYESNFDYDEARNYYEIVNCNNAQTMYLRLKGENHLAKIIDFLIEKYTSHDIRSERVAFIIKYSDSTEKEGYLLKNKYENETWFQKAKSILNQLEGITHLEVLDFSRKYTFFSFDFLVENELENLTTKQAIELYSTVKTFNEANIVYQHVISTKVKEFSDDELCLLINVCAEERQIYESHQFKELITVYNELINEISEASGRETLSYKIGNSKGEILVLKDFELSDVTKLFLHDFE